MISNSSSSEKDGIGTVYCIKSYRDKVISAGHDTVIRLWNATDGRLALKIKSNHTHLIKCMALYTTTTNGYDYLITGSWDNTLNVFSIERSNSSSSSSSSDSSDSPTINYVHTLRGHKNRVKSVCTGNITDGSDKKAIVFSGSDDNTIVAWGMLSAELLYTLEGHSRMVTGIDYLSSLLVSCSADKTIRLWTTHDGCCTKTISDQTADITCVLFVKPVVAVDIDDIDDRDDGVRLFCSGNAHGTVTIYNVSGDRLYKFEEYSSSLSSMTLYYHNTKTFILATTQDGCLMSWDVHSALKGPFFGRLSIKEEVSDNEDTFYWDKGSSDDTNAPTYVLHSICSVNNINTDTDTDSAIVVAGADGLLLFFYSKSFEKEYIPSPKSSRKARNPSSMDSIMDDDDKSVSSRSRAYDRSNPHIYKNSMRSNKSVSGLPSSRKSTKETLLESSLLPLGKPSPLSSSRMQQMMSSNSDKSIAMDDAQEDGVVIIHDGGKLRLRDSSGNRQELFQSNDRLDRRDYDYHRRSNQQNGNRRYNDDNMRLAKANANRDTSYDNNTNNGVTYIKKGNGEMIPVMQTRQQLNEVRSMSRMGRRVIQPQPSLSQLSSSVYYNDNSINNANEYIDKHRHQYVAKVATTNINLFDNFCEEKDKTSSLGRLKVASRLGTKKIVKVYLSKSTNHH